MSTMQGKFASDDYVDLEVVHDVAIVDEDGREISIDFDEAGKEEDGDDGREKSGRTLFDRITGEIHKRLRKNDNRG